MSTKGEVNYIPQKVVLVIRLVDCPSVGGKMETPLKSSDRLNQEVINTYFFRNYAL